MPIPAFKRANLLRTFGNAAATLVIAWLLSLPPQAYAADTSPVPTRIVEQIKAGVTTHTQGKVPVDQVASTALPGIYEVVTDGDIFYTDATGRYGFVGGSLMDMQTQQDLTAMQQDKLMAIPFDRLPLKLAVKDVRGDGSRTLAIFEDPNCPICRVFTKFLDQVDDVTVYRFMYPVVAPQQSQPLARMAWCSVDRAAVWRAIMDGARPQAPQNCDVSGLAQIIAVGEKYKINNTPTVILASGRRLVGATPPEEFLDALARDGKVRQ